jgi:hypothetical protein
MMKLVCSNGRCIRSLLWAKGYVLVFEKLLWVVRNSLNIHVALLLHSSFFILFSTLLSLLFSLLMLTHERITGNVHITSCTLWYVFSVANLVVMILSLFSLVWVIRLPHPSVSFRISFYLTPTVTNGILILLFVL